MTVRYSRRVARWIAEREGRELAPDGSLIVEHPLADAESGVRHVLQYGPEAEVIEPQSLREEIVRRLGGLAGR
jgi:predicted DNA-binding transcriptional regulator YafY